MTPKEGVDSRPGDMAQDPSLARAHARCLPGHGGTHRRYARLSRRVSMPGSTRTSSGWSRGKRGCRRLSLRARAEQLIPEGARRFSAARARSRASPPCSTFATGSIPPPASLSPAPSINFSWTRTPATEVGRRLSTQLSLDREHIMECIFTLHRHLLMGDSGSWVLVFVATGLVRELAHRFLPHVSDAGKVLQGLETRLARAMGRSASPSELRPASGDGAVAVHHDLHQLIGRDARHARRHGMFDKILAPVAPVYTADAAIAPYAQPIEGEPKLTWEAALPLARHLMAERARVEGFEIEGEASLSLDRETGVFVYSVRSSNDAFDSGGDRSLFERHRRPGAGAGASATQRPATLFRAGWRRCIAHASAACRTSCWSSSRAWRSRRLRSRASSSGSSGAGRA